MSSEGIELVLRDIVEELKSIRQLLEQWMIVDVVPGERTTLTNSVTEKRTTDHSLSLDDAYLGSIKARD